MRRYRYGGIALLLVGCGSEPVGVRGPLPPAIPSAAVVPNIHNVLSALVSARLVRTDSVAVRFRLEDGAPGTESVTPPVLATAEVVTIPLLGLLPDSRYIVHAVAYGEGGTVAGDPLVLTTGSLPPDLPRYSAGGTDPSPGYVVFAAGRYGLVIDNAGRVVWYR